MNAGLPDSELVNRITAGDMEAFKELVGRYGDPVIAFLYRLLGDYERARDLAQETFLRLHLRLFGKGAQAAQVGRCTSLVFTIAVNLGRDELRRRAVRREVPLADGLERPDSEPTPPAALRLKETQRQVRAALDSLPEPARALLVLRDVQGLSYEDIAAITGSGLGTVKSRINRARLAFKNAFLKKEKSSTPRAGGGE